MEIFITVCSVTLLIAYVFDLSFFSIKDSISLPNMRFSSCLCLWAIACIKMQFPFERYLYPQPQARKQISHWGNICSKIAHIHLYKHYEMQTECMYKHFFFIFSFQLHPSPFLFGFFFLLSYLTYKFFSNHSQFEGKMKKKITRENNSMGEFFSFSFNITTLLGIEHWGICVL